MLKTRFITAVVLLLGFLADLFFASVPVFALILALVVAAVGWEWSRLCHVEDDRWQSAYSAAAGVIVLIALYIPYNPDIIRWLLLFGFLFWASVPIIFYVAPVHRQIDSADYLLLITGLFIVVVSSVAIQYLRSFAPQGSSWLLLYALAIIWTMDVGAYFSGRKFGRFKLAPSISPGKTWEGVYGGLAGTLILYLLAISTAEWADGNYTKLFVVTLFAAFASVLGDLYESRIKRAAGRKDSSSLLPGHGGVLDRLDGVLSAVPVFAFFWAWL